MSQVVKAVTSRYKSSPVVTLSQVIISCHKEVIKSCHKSSQEITHKHGIILEDIENFEEKSAKTSKEFDIGNENHRDKRSFDIVDFFGSTDAFASTNNYNITTTPFFIASTSLIAIAVLLASNPTPGLAPSSSPQPGTYLITVVIR